MSHRTSPPNSGPKAVVRPSSAGEPTVFSPRRAAVLTGLALTAGLIGLMALVAAYPSFPQCVWCNMVVPFMDSGTGQTYLLDCSNVRQEVLSRENIVAEPADVPGWTVLRPVDPGRPAVLTVKLKKDREQVIFYPRMSGPEAFVEVWEEGQPTRLACVSGRAAWSPIGEQRLVRLLCAQNGWRNDYDVTLRLVCSGRWAQIWIKDGRIFF